MTDEQIEIRLNGSSRAVRRGLSLGDLLEELSLDRRAVVVERNEEIVRRDDLDDARLREGDTVEVVHFVGGGAGGAGRGPARPAGSGPEASEGKARG